MRAAILAVKSKPHGCRRAPHPLARRGAARLRRRGLRARGLAPARCARSGRADGRGRAPGIGRPRDDAAAALRAPNQGGRRERHAQHPHRRGARRDRAGGRRQRHGPPGDEARRRGRDRQGAHRRQRLGRHALQQPRRPGVALRAHAARRGHDRSLPRRGKRQSPSAVGRPRHAALHQPDLGRDPRARRAAHRARHGDDGRFDGQGEDQDAAGRAAARGLEAIRLPILGAPARASCCRSVATRDTVLRSWSASSPARSTARRWVAK
jgi:hypothetical protein